MKAEKNIQYDILVVAVTETLLQAGLQEDHAKIAAEAICTASLCGVDSHGIRLLPHYVQAIDSGRINKDAVFAFKKTASSIGLLDANHGIAHAAVSRAMEHAISLAQEEGSGFVSVKNSNHCGAMAYYAMQACDHDMIGLAFTNATAKLQTFNSTKPFFGINPFCFAAPMEGEDHFCYDAAPSVMSNNKVKMFKEKGEQLPPEVAADNTGAMTLDPSLAAMLIPLGGLQAAYKGFGMAMVGDIFCSLLSGMPNGKDVSTMYENDGGNIADKRHLGQFVGAIRIDAFQEITAFKKRLKGTVDEIRALPSLEKGKQVMVPGDPEKRAKEQRLAVGIPVPKSVLEVLTTLNK